MQGSSAGGWITSLNSLENPKARILCLPYEGGTADYFNSWLPYLRSGVELLAVELPGHGRRSPEAPCSDMETVVRHVVEASFEHLHDKPLLIFGHSLGALLAYETTVAFAKAELPMPRRLIISGCQAPSDTKTYSPRMAHLDDQDFFEDLVNEDCLSERVLKEPEAIAMELESIRADYEMKESYSYRTQALLNIPVEVFAGSRDCIPLGNLLDWQYVCRQPVHVCVFKGGHFFIEDDKATMLSHMNEVFDEVIVSGAYA
ncbi:MAG: alpha/beta fold hydrolase [Ketobacteraceae bacterium]|nr:alpha/beta fold hydrolase [Ketobacteraceae bacterium]